MKIKDYKCKCGCNDFFFADKGNQKRIYCTKCGKWLKWADKDEKNLVMRCLYTDEEIAKSFIEDVEAVKYQLPCGQIMEFPKTFDEFVKDYGFKDKQEVYTNGVELISVYRVKQWLEHISTTKNDLAVSSGLEKNSKKLEKDFDELDCISRKSVITIIQNHWWNCRDIDKLVNELPSVTPIRAKGHWIEHEKSISTAFKHLRECSCCKCYFDWMMPRNSYCPNCGADMREVEE